MTTVSALDTGDNLQPHSRSISPEVLPQKRHRILIVDDNSAIHDDFRKILGTKKSSTDLDASEELLFGEPSSKTQTMDFQIDSAFQGQEALLLVEKSILENDPYTMAFVDVRMPPGWDGVETVGHLWQVDPRLQVVLCTAYSDYSWKEIIGKLDRTDRLLILKKPFDIIEIHQLVCSLTEKWLLARRVEAQVENLEGLVSARTADLQNSLAMIQATLEATADGILAINQDGVKFNKRFLEMWKVPSDLAEEADADHILEFITAQIESPSFLKKFQNPAPNVSSTDFDIVKFQDGRVFECFAQAQSLEGKAIGTVWSFRDITKRVVLENQLRQAQKMECVGQLAGGVAHDFNNMLTVIQGYSILLRNTVSENDKPAVEEIHAASQRAAGLTRQLLAFSRRQVMQPVDVDLRQVITTSSRMLRPLIGEDVEFDIKLSDEPLSVHADTGMIEQILMNLAINSRDAMPNGGRFSVHAKRVTIDAAEAAKYPDATIGQFISMEVKDTGCGIPTESLPHVFEPFFTTKEVGKGTGLGLATVYGIVKQHRGWISVQSEIGVGTTFNVHLPVAKAIETKPQPKRVLGKLCGGDETILLVEDEATVRGLAARILKMLGYKVLEAASAVKALESYRDSAGDINLLLTDMVMPDGMSGRELAENMQAANPKIKTIFTSGFSPELFGKNISLKEGCNFLQKPYPPEILAKTIRDSLDGKA